MPISSHPVKLLLDEQLPRRLSQRLVPLPVIFLDVPSLKYDTMKQLVPQVLALLAQPGLAGGVHTVELPSAAG